MSPTQESGPIPPTSLSARPSVAKRPNCPGAPGGQRVRHVQAANPLGAGFHPAAGLFPHPLRQRLRYDGLIACERSLPPLAVRAPTLLFGQPCADRAGIHSGGGAPALHGQRAADPAQPLPPVWQRARCGSWVAEPFIAMCGDRRHTHALTGSCGGHPLSQHGPARPCAHAGLPSHRAPCAWNLCRLPRACARLLPAALLTMRGAAPPPPTHVHLPRIYSSSEGAAGGRIRRGLRRECRARSACNPASRSVQPGQPPPGRSVFGRSHPSAHTPPPPPDGLS